MITRLNQKKGVAMLVTTSCYAGGTGQVYVVELYVRVTCFRCYPSVLALLYAIMQIMD